MRLALVAVLACAACSLVPATISSTHTPAPSTSGERALYVTDSFNGSGLLAIDPLTLRDLSSKPLLPIGSTGSNSSFLMASDDGGTLAVANYSSYGYGQRVAAEGLDISMYDARTGALRARFNPEVPVMIDGLSADGSRIYAGNWPPRELTAERLILDATNGRVLLREPAFSFPGDNVSVVRDGDARRLYALLVSADPNATGPRAVELAAWDLRTGKALWRLGLPSLLAGDWLTGRTFGGVEVRSRLVPGLALSPDGSRVAVVCCAATGSFWLVDAASGQLLSQRTYGGTSFFERLFAPSVALAKSPEDSVIVNASFGVDGRLLHVYAQSSRVDEHGDSQHQYLGMATVAVEDAKVLGTDVKMEVWWYENRIFWTRPSPDGKWLYVFLERGGNPEPKFYVLRRVDAATLRVLTGRKFDTYRQAFVLRSP